MIGLLNVPQNAYVVEVTDNSLESFHIKKGDALIIEPDRPPKSGDICVLQSAQDENNQILLPVVWRGERLFALPVDSDKVLEVDGKSSYVFGVVVSLARNF